MTAGLDIRETVEDEVLIVAVSGPRPTLSRRRGAPNAGRAGS